jgi:DNA mismatch repair protein MutL
MKAVQATIQQIALCHPHVTWQVWQNDRQWFTLSPGATTGHLLPQILRQVHLSDFQQLKVDLSPPSSEGLWANSSLVLVLGLPDRCHRHRPDWVRVAVNGRMVKLPELEQTILSATSRTLPRDRYPICFLHLLISPNQINWNRHPAKAEIYLHAMSYWQEQIARAIEQALRISPANLPESFHLERVGKLIKAAEVSCIYDVSRSIQPAPDSEVVPILIGICTQESPPPQMQYHTNPRKMYLTQMAIAITPNPTSGYCPGSQYLYSGRASGWLMVGRAAHCP